MVKQNIKIAIVSIIACLTFWLVIFNFIKIDVSTTSLINLTDSTPQISIEPNIGSYIENHNIEKIRMNYHNQFYWCNIYYTTSSSDYYNYAIILPDVVDKTQKFFTTTIIVDKLNVYQYLFKK